MQQRSSKMKKFYTAVLVAITILALTTGSVIGSGRELAANGPAHMLVGADCTDPPNLVPFADLRDCDLSGMQLAGVNLFNANLSGANLSNSNLSNATLSGVNLTDAVLTGAILDGADMFTTTLIGAVFDSASLLNTNLEDGYAPGASFIDADLRGANLYFFFARDANFTGANFSDSWLGSFDVVGSNLQNAKFAGSNIFGVDMQNTDLRGADFSSSELSYVTLHNADLRNANLLGAENDVGNGWNGVIWGNTICGDGSNSDDDDGDGFTCLSNFVANQPPTVSLTAPPNNATVINGSTVTISADAADSDGSVIRVQFFAGSTLLGTDPTAPYSLDWTTTAVGSFVITAQAHDDDLAVTTSQPVTVNVVPPPNNLPPSVAITAPANNAIVYRLLGTTIRATASDPDGAVTKVEFYTSSFLLNIDTSAPYSYFWRPAIRGVHILTAKAYDNSGAVTTSAPITVIVR
jgi:uncharacterized protein YjbI with pentapeptide repeats